MWSRRGTSYHDQGLSALSRLVGRGDHFFMGSDDTIEYLTEDEALKLAAEVPVGRVVYSRFAMPAIHLVNFKLDGKDVVFKTRKGAKFAAAVADTVVAFEVDRVDEDTRSGWTVTLTGRSKLVTSPAEQQRLAALGVEPWLPDREYFIRVQTQLIAGRRIRPHELVGHDAEGQ
jgi:nitroimidazol reductase NimA-like FMN-containing flavoprotein (pyridoxamine 5'-phosphate oxidase superfamily)